MLINPFAHILGENIGLVNIKVTQNWERCFPEEDKKEREKKKQKTCHKKLNSDAFNNVHCTHNVTPLSVPTITLDSRRKFYNLFCN